MIPSPSSFLPPSPPKKTGRRVGRKERKERKEREGGREGGREEGRKGGREEGGGREQGGQNKERKKRQKEGRCVKDAFMVSLLPDVTKSMLLSDFPASLGFTGKKNKIRQNQFVPKHHVVLKRRFTEEKKNMRG